MPEPGHWKTNFDEGGIGNYIADEPMIFPFLGNNIEVITRYESLSGEGR